MVGRLKHFFTTPQPHATPQKRPQFLVAWIRSPLKIGALTPSSKSLARAMARQVDLSEEGMVVELGAGTGAVTHALALAIPAERLLIVEREQQQKIKISNPEIFEREEKQKSEPKEKIDYTLESHLSSATPETQKLFLELKEQISALDESIIEEAKAKYVAYKLTTNFCDIVILRDALKIFLNMQSGTLDDPHGIARDLTKPKPIGHWGNGDYEVKVEKLEDIEKVMELIRQSYLNNK